MAAGGWALSKLTPDLYARLDALGARLAAGFAGAAGDAGVDLQINRLGSVLTPFFTAAPVRDYDGAVAADTAAYARFFRGMLARGVYPPPSQFEGWFLSAAHTRRDVDRTVAAARETLGEMPRRRPAGRLNRPRQLIDTAVVGMVLPPVAADLRPTLEVS